jgi:hypothetical protein
MSRKKKKYVEYSTFNDKTSDAIAAEAGREIAEFFGTAKALHNLSAATNTHDPYILEMYTVNTIVYNKLSDTARAIFLKELAAPFGAIQITGIQPSSNQSTDETSALRKLVWTKSATNTGVNKALPQAAVIVVPISQSFLKDSVTHTLSFQVFRQTSNTSGRENSTELYFVVEQSLKIEVIPKIYNIDLKSGVKLSEKKFERSDLSTAERIGQAVSVSFKVEKFARTCMAFYSKDPQSLKSGPSAITQYGYIVRNADIKSQNENPIFAFGNSKGEVGEDDALPQAMSQLAKATDSAMLEIVKQASMSGRVKALRQ